MFKRVEVICSINPIQDGLFRGYSRMGRAEKPPPLFLKICCTYPTMIKLGSVMPYVKKIQKINNSCDTPLEFSIFHRKPANFVISRNTDI